MKKNNGIKSIKKSSIKESYRLRIKSRNCVELLLKSSEVKNFKVRRAIDESEDLYRVEGWFRKYSFYYNTQSIYFNDIIDSNFKDGRVEPESMAQLTEDIKELYEFFTFSDDEVYVIKDTIDIKNRDKIFTPRIVPLSQFVESHKPVV